MTHAVRTAAALALTVAAVHAATPWAPPAGTSDTVTYAAGRTEHGLFTDAGPAVADDTFLFTPNNFYAQSGGQQADDAASFLVTAKPGRTLGGVTARLQGDWSIFGLSALSLNAVPIALGPSVNAVATLTLTNPATNAVLVRHFDFGNDFAAEDGTFDHTVQLPTSWKSAKVSLSAALTATADPGSTAYVQFKTASVHADTAPAATAVPLPPAVLAAIPGAIVAYAARRRMRA